MAIRKETAIVISPPNFQIGVFKIRGVTPYVQHKFSTETREEIKAAQEAGPISRKGKKRKPKDFQACYEQAIHYSTDGWAGIPAPGIRAALISACRVVGFHMTKAKLAIFVEHDGFEVTDGVPMVRITKGKPHYFEMPVRLESGVIDIHARPMWDPGWEAIIRIKFDGDMFSLEDVANLLYRAGQQVGLGEGRHDSRKSTGLGWGVFDIVREETTSA